MTHIVIDFEVNEEFIEMFHRAGQHKYTLFGEGKMSLEEVRDMVREVCRTKKMQDQERLGFLRLYDGDKLVGLSVPRAIQKIEHKVWLLPKDKDYYRMGMIFIDEPYRGKGYGKDAATLFLERYKNLLWTIEPTNEPSKRLAAYIGLERNATLYLKGSAWQHKPWGHDRKLEIWNN